MFRGKLVRGHNDMLGRVRGVDGIKTGYIRASGFNLAASAVRNNHRLIGVIMGGESAHARDLKMAALLNDGFNRAAPDDTSNALVASATPPAAQAFSSSNGAF
jgi:D-alanyl-D-alanine carboxypeptidase